MNTSPKDWGRLFGVSAGGAGTPCVWVLNLDAEHELESGPRYAPTAQLRALVAKQQERLVGELLLPGDYLLRESLGDGSTSAPLELMRLSHNEYAAPLQSVDTSEARDLPGLAWSPTPRALSQLSSVGAHPVSAPDVAILRRVNARPFAAELHNTFRHSALGHSAFRSESFEKHIAHSLDQALSRLGNPAADGWLVRRTFGAAGRGRRRIASGKPNAGELDWLIASLRRGPLVLEPWVHITREFTLSGWVGAGEAIASPNPCFQETTEFGAWKGTEFAAANEVLPSDDSQLQEVFEATGRALASAGYRGPFGIDAYLHRVPGSLREVLNPLSEINARFTMDWSYATDTVSHSLPH